MGRYFGLRGQALNWAIGTIAGCDFLLFGYGEFKKTYGSQAIATIV